MREQGCVSPSESMPAKPGCPDLLASRFEVAGQQVGVAEGHTGARREYQTIALWSQSFPNFFQQSFRNVCQSFRNVLPKLPEGLRHSRKRLSFDWDKQLKCCYISLHVIENVIRGGFVDVVQVFDSYLNPPPGRIALSLWD
jgi:hypothetical protein